MDDPSQDTGQTDRDGERPIHVQGQSIQVGDRNRMYNTWVVQPDPNHPKRRPRPAAPGNVESPYRGLLAFGEQDAAFFFGQDAASDAILDRLRAGAEAPALMVVSGVSGSGKSSLLRAGVLPYLGEITPDGSSWPCLTLTPARSPLSELAACTARRTDKDAATLLRTLREDPASFAMAAREAEGTAGNGGDRGRLVLVVDQFEQVFTQCADENERRAFITALHAAATVGYGPQQVPAAMVILVVRADFEARCAEYEELVEAIQDNRYFLPPMTERQLRLAITEPARAAGASVDEALVAKLVETIRNTPSRSAAEGTAAGTGVLPHLSHVLDQVWRQRAGNPLTLDDYEREGGIEGSIGASADEAYELLTPSQQETARQVFTRLVATTDSGTDAGDRASIAELTEGKEPAGAADVQTVLEAYAARRLLTITADSVELSHETLLTAWPLLRDTWLAETHADRIVRAQLRTAAASWDGHGRNRSYLYRGTQLAALRGASAHWSADPARHPPLTGIECDFLHAASRAAIQRRLITAALALLLVVSLAATTITFASGEATARHQASFATSSQLAVQSEAADSTDPVTAAMLAATSWRIDPGNPSARGSLLDAYAQPDHATLNSGGGPMLEVAYSRDGKMLATADAFGMVRFWSTVTRTQIGAPITVSGGNSVNGVAFSPDGKTLATAHDDGKVRLWDVATRTQTGKPLTVPGSNGTGVNGVAFSPNGQALATAGSDGRVRLWSVPARTQTGTPITIPGSGSSSITSGISGVAFSPNGQTLATADGDDTTRLWDLAFYNQIGRPVTVPNSGNGIAGGVAGVAFSPNGQALATAASDGMAGSDGMVWLWNSATGAQADSPITIPDGVNGVAFSPDGKTLATADEDRTVRLWNVATRTEIGAPITVPGSGNGGVGGVAFSPNGQALATAGSDGRVRLWSVAARTEIGAPIIVPGNGGFGNSIGGVAFSPDGKTLATADGDETARLWDVATRTEIGGPIAVPGNSSDNGPDIGGVAFSPDGKTLATADGDTTVRLWDVATRTEIGGPMGVPDSSSAPGGTDVNGVAFSPDGKTLATAHDDGKVRFWDIAFPDNLLKAACGIAGRSLTRQEWKSYVPSEPFQQVCAAS